MMKLGDYKKQIMMKLDEYEDAGENFTSDEELARRLPYAINEAVRFVFLAKNDKRMWRVTQVARTDVQWIEHAIPRTLYQIERVYAPDGTLCREYDVVAGKLLLPAKIDGEFSMESTYFPEEITPETPNTKLIDVPLDTEHIIIAKACAILTKESDDYDDYVEDYDQSMRMLDTRIKTAAVTVRRLF
jgi:hypothetical protein